MPRKPRLYVPGIPVHVIQRGNNRGACFFAEADYRFYLDTLGEAAREHGCAVHAYVLMTNHVHLLMTPQHDQAIGKTLQALGRRYVYYVNHTYRRTGTLWEGRHKASLIDSDAYLLTCYRYIELNPVRAGMVEDPGAYRWSSYRHHALGVPDAAIDEHPLYRDLGSTIGDRSHAYRALFQHHLDPEDMRRLRETVNVGLPLGNDRFREQIEQALQRKLGYPKPGRPRRHGVREANLGAWRGW